MWLLDTSSLVLKFFNGPSAVGEYAILSHTWGEEEVTFQDMANPAAATKKKGWAKIKATCKIAREDHKLSYAWVDTCCIDKSSSAELSEAINSMFSWYKEADLCMAYLEDYTLPSLQVQDQPSNDGNNLSSCRWFTRGWTLQELIAPRDVLFYNASWAPVGLKSTSISLLSEITGIDGDVLWNFSYLEHCHVAMRMSWAAKRKTTRVEDIAYCLLGIFGISMPLLYGEGEKAFLRLQEGIAQSRNDLTLFAWRQLTSQSSRYRGLFATSPLEFQFSAGLRVPPTPMLAETEFIITNRGVRFNSHICVDWKFYETHIRRSSDDYDALVLGLDCIEQSTEGLDTGRWVGIHLRKIGADYLRFEPWTFSLQPSRNTFRSPPVVAYIPPSLSNSRILRLLDTAELFVDSNKIASRYIVSCDETLRSFITPSVPAAMESKLAVGGADHHGHTIICTRSFHESLALHQFDFKFTPDKGTTVHSFMLLTGATDVVWVSDNGKRRQVIFWYALLLVDQVVKHWSRVSGAARSSSQMNVSYPDFQDYIFARFSNEVGVITQGLLPTLVDIPGNDGYKHQVHAGIRDWDASYKEDTLITPAITLGYRHLKL